MSISILESKNSPKFSSSSPGYNGTMSPVQIVEVVLELPGLLELPLVEGLGVTINLPGVTK